MTTAIYGGSFDPVHRGHIKVASYIASLPGIDRVWLMVSRRNPLKPHATRASDADRLNMASLACRGIDGVEASDFEMYLPSPSFSIDTLRALSKAFPDENFPLIIGADNWADIDRWKSHDEIIRDYGLIVYPRPGFPAPDNVEGVRFLPDAPLIDVSSTMIRDRIASGEPTEGLIAPEVEQYIKTHNLYSSKL